MAKNKTVGFLGGKFLPLHQGHIYAILEASTKVDELYVVLTSSKARDKELCERDGIKPIPAEVRLSWLGEAFNNLENIKIVHVEDDKGNDDYDWEDGAKKIKEVIEKPIDVVFSSESSYKKHFDIYYPGAEHIVIDEERKNVPISATKLRKNIFDNWDKIPKSVRPYFVKKVALVGTESCGKSTLAKKLAKFYNTEYIEEVGRKYCEKYTNQLTPDMFNLIAMEHFLLQKKAAENANKVIFIDSEATITQFYLNMYFKGERSKLIDEVAKLQEYDLVLYLEPDVKWVADGFRNAGEEKQRIANNEKLKSMLTQRNIHFEIIKGSYNDRFNKARTLVDKLFNGEIK